LRDQGLVQAKSRQRTDLTHVLAAVLGLNRLERVGETARAALNELVVVAPDWLQALAPLVWYERYDRRTENYRLQKAEKERLDLAATIGADGDQLLAAVDAQSSSRCLRDCPPSTFSVRSGRRNTSKTMGCYGGAPFKRRPQPPSKSHRPTTRRHAMGIVPVADPGGRALRPEAIRRGAAPILVWPKDRKTGLVRVGARFNHVLLLRVLDDAGQRADGQACGVLRDLSPCRMPHVRTGDANLPPALSVPRV
jgi:hypothetical protein